MEMIIFKFRACGDWWRRIRSGYSPPLNAHRHRHRQSSTRRNKYGIYGRDARLSRVECAVADSVRRAEDKRRLNSFIVVLVCVCVCVR